jgi:ATP-independent RNA helicase DbpA
MNDFRSLQLADELLQVLTELGFEKPTEIQSQCIPILLAGKDLIGQSKTGSGKTAAFGLPMLQNVDLSLKRPQGLILCPTRELGAQVARDLKKMGRALTGLQVLPIAGGQPLRPQAEALQKGVHVIVATPGRLLDHLNRGLDLSDLKILVLDEADKMLEMGFEQDLDSILQSLPAKRQTALFSATFPERIELLSRQFQNRPQKISIEHSSELAPMIEQIRYEEPETEKINLLARILQQHPASSCIIFCNQKATVAEIGQLLQEQKVAAGALHGDLEQRDRDKVLALFRNGSYRILVATDVAARGLDIDSLELVINYDLPSPADVYVHRIGRTGRAGKTGTAISITKPNDALKVFEYEKATGQKIQLGSLGFKNQHGLGGIFQMAKMQTLTISGGRKDKLRPGDILGALTNGSPALTSSEIGKIEIHDQLSYVAVEFSAAKKAFEKLRDGRIKGKRFQIRQVR